MRREGVLTSIFKDRLPEDWTVSVNLDFMQGGPDAIVEVAAPDGSDAMIVVEVRSKLDPVDVPALAETLQRYSSGPAMVLAPYLSPRTQDVLQKKGISYADLTGNVYIATSSPALFLRDQGAKADPWREVRPIHTLKGSTAGRVVRGLCDLRPPYGIRELAERIRTPVASVSRVAALVAREGLLTRGERGEIVDVDWPGLIERWTQDYGFARSNHTSAYLEPRGLDRVLGRIEELDATHNRPYAITGSIAAAQVAPFAPPRLLAIYAENSDRFAEDLDLRPVASGMNVLLAEPFDHVALERTWRKDETVYASLSQVAADLLTGPGRSPSEGEELIRWMKDHEDEWRI